jgi:hypothetical protein
MAGEPVEVVRKLIDAFNALDVDAVTALGKAVSATFRGAE